VSRLGEKRAQEQSEETSQAPENLPEIGQNFSEFRENHISECSRGDRDNYHSSNRKMQNPRSKKEKENEKSTATRNHRPIFESYAARGLLISRDANFSTK
jgi:hypothetical protein